MLFSRVAGGGVGGIDIAKTVPTNRARTMPTKPTSLIGRGTIRRLLHAARNTPHDAIAEVGVYKGGTAYYLALLARAQRRELHLYDTFTGIPMKGVHDRHNVGDFNDTNVHAVLPLVRGAHVHVGLFPDTFTEHQTAFSFVHVDCDQYESILSCIRTFSPLMVRGGVMWFDDYDCLASANRAVDESFHYSRIERCVDKVFVRF